MSDSLLPRHASCADVSSEVVTSLATTHTLPLPAVDTHNTELEKTDTHPTELEKTDVHNTELERAASTKSPASSFFTVSTGGSNSKAEDDSLFGEPKKQEVLFTSFSDLLQSEKPAPSGVSVKQSLEQEKVIQQASQQILSPNNEKDPAEEGKRLLDSLLSGSKATGLGMPMLSRESGRKRERVKLDLTEEKRQSITMLDDDETGAVKKPSTKPKAKTARKKGRSKRS